MKDHKQIVEEIVRDAEQRNLPDPPVRFSDIPGSRDPHAMMLHEEAMLRELDCTQKLYLVPLNPVYAKNPVVRFFQKIIFRALRPTLENYAARQSEFNASVVRTLQEYHKMDLAGEIREIYRTDSTDDLWKEVRELKEQRNG